MAGAVLVISATTTTCFVGFLLADRMAYIKDNPNILNVEKVFQIATAIIFPIGFLIPSMLFGTFASLGIHAALYSSTILIGTLAMESIILFAFSIDKLCCTNDKLIKTNAHYKIFG